MTDEELIAEMTTRGLTAPPANLIGIHDVTLRAEFMRRGLLPVAIEVKAEAERLGLFKDEEERRKRALEWKERELRQAFAATEREWLRQNAEAVRDRDDWKRRYQELSDRRPMGFFDALRALWAAVWHKAAS
jgi:hypothetical protein